MSLCLITETKDCVWIGSDVAISHRIDGRYYRERNREMEKVFCHKNAVFFIGGSIINATMIRRYIERRPQITANDIPDIAATMRNIVKQNVQDKEIQTIMIMALLDSGRVYGIAEGNDFQVDSPIPPQLTGYKSVCCVGVLGSDGGRGRELSDKYYARTKDIRQTYSKVFSDMSNNGIGGSHVDLYRLDIKNQTITRYAAPIKESGIEYVSAMATMGAGSSINWSYVNTDPKTTNAQNTANSAYNYADSAYSLAYSANSAASNADALARRIASGTFSGGTFINGREIYSPKIFANEFNIIPENQWDRDGVFSIKGYYNSSTLWDMFRLSYYAGDAAFINFDSPAGAYSNWNFDRSSFGKSGSYISFQGNVSFSGANVTGLTAVFA